jgi:CHASE3 domain sensor protein
MSNFINYIKSLGFTPAKCLKTLVIFVAIILATLVAYKGTMFIVTASETIASYETVLQKHKSENLALLAENKLLKSKNSQLKIIIEQKQNEVVAYEELKEQIKQVEDKVVMLNIEIVQSQETILKLTETNKVLTRELKQAQELIKQLSRVKEKGDKNEAYYNNLANTIFG